MSPLNVLIKPASSLCQLRCKYCFYHSLSENRSVSSYGFMKEEVSDIIIQKALQEAKGSLSFAFQGGEPTLRGLEFFENFVFSVKRHNTNRLPVHYALQTNGQLIDDTWSSFFQKNNFLIGLSIDGDKSIHDSLRVTPGGLGTFNVTMRAVESFIKFKVDFNILTVVSNRLARHADKVYRFYKANDFRYLQFIPCLPPLDKDAEDDLHAVSADRYASFMIRLFDLWYEDLTHGRYVSIRRFDNYIQVLNGLPPEQCGLSGSCVCQMVIEADGSVFPCDFYVNDDWYLGSIIDRSFRELSETDRAVQFIRQSRAHPAECLNCRWYPLCRNGCRRDRYILSDESFGTSRFCPAYQAFFDAVFPRLQEIAARSASLRT